MPFITNVLRRLLPPPARAVTREEPRGRPAVLDDNGADAKARRIVELLLPGETQRLRVVHHDGPPPLLDAFEYKHANVPEGAKLRAWAKVQETERRLAVASWAMGRTEPQTGMNKVLAQDSIGACFYAFEATIQVLKDDMERGQGQKGRGWFDPWLRAHPSHTLVLRSIRTVRHLAVHVDDVRSDGGVSISAVLGHGGTITWGWRLPWLTPEMLAALDSPKIRPDELEAYKEVRKKQSLPRLLQDAMGDLRQVVFDAELLL